ncbi:HET-domain-containing protein [Lepidopterella palustris CBS 459.81]|uniref:HET-domain-containing protein n=1 Tax=Lepidopterella palustris CBS 459.81 TaxID=1314670 RepID=A0A8E2J977_9PEZI|nr:HET-domain-containing protein [Lepidopterella palustris CBS 459.81]
MILGEAERPRTRILYLEPGSQEESLRCSLRIFRLDRAPEFEALSYVWGNSKNAKIIQCSGESLVISHNLHGALIRLRHHDQHRILWVDAICINQEDLDERAKQVQLMGAIYAQAKNVIVWLGPELPEDSKAFEFIEAINPILGETQGRTPSQTEEAIKKISEDKSLPSDGWSHIEALFHRPYFSRIWVIQEVARAKQTIVLCGSRSTNYQTLIKAYLFCFDAHVESLRDISMRAGVPSLNTILSSNVLVTNSCAVNRSKGYSIYDLLCNTTTLSTGEPRDRLFALLSLPIIPYEWVPLPDYKSSVSEVYKNFAVLDITHNRSLRMLSWVVFTDAGNALGADVPSWVPNFNPRGTSSHFTYMSSFRSQFAGGSTDVVASVDTDGTILTLEGRAVATINRLCKSRSSYFDAASRKLPRKATEFSAATDIEAAWMTECHNVLIAANCCQTREDFVNVMNSERYTQFLRALCTNWNPATQKAPDERDFAFTKVAVLSLMARQPEWEEQDAYQLMVAQGYSVKVQFCCLEDGRLGWAPQYAKSGDMVVIFDGAVTPSVLRPARDGTFQFIGECYMNGLMKGEVLQMDKKQEKFRIR